MFVRNGAHVTPSSPPPYTCIASYILAILVHWFILHLFTVKGDENKREKNISAREMLLLRNEQSKIPLPASKKERC